MVGSATSDTILSMLPANAPPELVTAVRDHLATIDPMLIVGMLADAMHARLLLDDGDQAGAAEILAPYKAQAEAAGLAELFNSLLAQDGDT